MILIVLLVLGGIIAIPILGNKDNDEKGHKKSQDPRG